MADWSWVAGDRRVAHDDQLAGTRLVRVEDGSGDGARLLEAWTPAGLHVEILLDRAFDLYTVRAGGVPVSWLGPSGLQRRHAHEPGGYGWLRTFHGGLVVTCGLEHFGGPATRDAAEFAPPGPRAIELGEHGRISHQAATLVRREVVAGPEPAIVLVAEVRQAALYGEQFLLRREYRLPLARRVITLTDEVTNVGPLPSRHVIVYHMNLGFPLVDEASRLAARTEDGHVSIEQGPLGPSTPEDVLRLRLAADGDGMVRAAVENPGAGLRVQLAADPATLPAFFVWKLARDRANVLGLNPASHWSPDDAGPLEPGASRLYRWELEMGSSS